MRLCPTCHAYAVHCRVCEREHELRRPFCVARKTVRLHTTADGVVVWGRGAYSGEWINIGLLDESLGATARPIVDALRLQQHLGFRIVPPAEELYNRIKRARIADPTYGRWSALHGG